MGSARTIRTADEVFGSLVLLRDSVATRATGTTARPDGGTRPTGCLQVRSRATDRRLPRRHCHDRL